MRTNFHLPIVCTRPRPATIVKRLLDLTISAILLIALSPFLLLIGIAIKIDSKGPIFYRQERIGRGFRPFRIYKLRTMVVGADRNGPLITTSGDSRLTRIGQLLRKRKLDEVPQLLNVLLGQMSLVGPRPEVRPYVERFRRDYETILSVRPGITDLASLKYINEESVLAANWEEEYLTHILPDKILLAKRYSQQSSMMLDLGILGATLKQVLLK
jgi:lipopolysaccharide/colanic/teichoic acid biosynthesis glycosyltransferase